jgi:hypothetical protein
MFVWAPSYGMLQMFYVVFTVHFDNIQQLNQQMHFISY